MPVSLPPLSPAQNGAELRRSPPFSAFYSDAKKEAFLRKRKPFSAADLVVLVRFTQPKALTKPKNSRPLTWFCRSKKTESNALTRRKLGGIVERARDGTTICGLRAATVLSPVFLKPFHLHPVWDVISLLLLFVNSQFSIAAINDTDSRGQWEPLAPSKEAQVCPSSQEVPNLGFLPSPPTVEILIDDAM